MGCDLSFGDWGELQTKVKGDDLWAIEIVLLVRQALYCYINILIFSLGYLGLNWTFAILVSTQNFEKVS